MRRSLEVCSGFLVFLIGMELLLRLLPTSTASLTGYYIDPDILTYPSGHRWTASTGWDMRNAQRLSANNLGFVSDIDFIADRQAVVLVGDSYIEASMLPAASRPGAQLQRQLVDRPVYAMGSPGTALLDYAERIRYAATRLQAQNFIVLMEPGDVEQSLCGSGNVHSICLDPVSLTRQRQRLADASAAKKWLRHSALAQYLVSQLKVEPAKLWATAFRRDTPHGSESEQGTTAHTLPAAPATAADLAAERRTADRVADEFLRVVHEHARGRVMIVVDGQRPPTVQRGTSTLAASDWFVRRAREAGLTVVELDGVYVTHRSVSEMSLSVSPSDGHLNALGVALATRAMSDEFNRSKR